MKITYIIKIGFPIFNNYDGVCGMDWETKQVDEKELEDYKRTIHEDDYAELDLTFCSLSNHIPNLNTLSIDQIW